MPDRGSYFKPFLIILFFFVALFAYSKFGPNLPISLAVQVKGEPLTVSGEGKVTVPNETAKLSVGIDESGSNLAQVQESVNKKTKTLIDSLKRLGVEEKDIKTVSYNISPQQDFSQNPPRITGYNVGTSYEVKINDLDKVNEALNVVTASGANMVGGISFDVKDETRLEKLNEARAEAAKKAREKAQGLAKAAGLTLGRVINVSEFEGGGGPVPMAVREAGVGLDVAKTEPQIQPGINEITVTVHLTFEVR